MNDSNGYAVFLFPQALEVLGDAIKPYLQQRSAQGDTQTGGEPHLLCNAIDTGGAFVEMTLLGHAADGREMTLELMIPTGMVRMVVSTHSDDSFGFARRAATAQAEADEDTDATPSPVAGV
ncbi:MAG: hypothetical protein ACREO8_02645 [Luteimonas sp.]